VASAKVSRSRGTRLRRRPDIKPYPSRVTRHASPRAQNQSCTRLAMPYGEYLVSAARRRRQHAYTRGSHPPQATLATSCTVYLSSTVYALPAPCRSRALPPRGVAAAAATAAAAASRKRCDATCGGVASRGQLCDPVLSPPSAVRERSGLRSGLRSGSTLEAHSAVASGRKPEVYLLEGGAPRCESGVWRTARSTSPTASRSMRTASTFESAAVPLMEIT